MSERRGRTLGDAIVHIWESIDIFVIISVTIGLWWLADKAGVIEALRS